MIRSKIISSIKSLNLNLKGLTVLTEAANGPYCVTPIISALAGAKTYAFVKTSKHGSVKEVIEESRQFASQFGQLDIEYVKEMEKECLLMQMVTSTLVILKMENFMDKEFLPQLMVRKILGNL